MADFRSELRKKKVDTILEAFYRFDNGRGDQATYLFFWTENNLHFMKAIRYKTRKKIKDFPIKDCPQFEHILDFYFENIKDIVGVKLKETGYMSHNYGYYTRLTINQVEFKSWLRNEKRYGDPEHYRSKWISMIDKIARPYIEK